MISWSVPRGNHRRRGQPEEELEEPSHPDQEFHNAVKTKAMAALNMLARSIQIGECTGTVCVFCGGDRHSFRNCDTNFPSLRQC